MRRHDHQDEEEPARALGVFDGCAYWGIAFDPKYVANRGGDDPTSLIDDWQNGFPLLRRWLPVPSADSRRRRRRSS
jgi:hypothetical protein